MRKRQLAFEIGCEEIPARFLPGAIDNLQLAAQSLLANLRLSCDGVRAMGTPRRLVLLVDGVAERQAELVEAVRGPSQRVAFDADGNPTAAAIGFARAQGVDVAALTVRETPQGTYVYAERRETGQPAASVLTAALPQLLENLEFPRTMRWGGGEARFIRPVRWLVALLDEELLPVRFGTVVADRFTFGHRTLAPGPHRVASAGDLLTALEAAFVIVDREQRQQRVREAVVAAGAGVGGEAVIVPETLSEVTDLVEWPTAFTGSFAAEYLDLPEELLLTTMRVNQRYFPVNNDQGRLLPYFVAVRNGDATNLDVVRAGNEKVLRARFADAKFFYDEDRNLPLAEYVPKLADVTFLEGMGTLLDKTERLRALVAWLIDNDAVAGGAAARAAAMRAAELAKADLVTRLVYEFPDLAGIAGRAYALHAGEPPEVATALEQHYWPHTGGDELPDTPAGYLLAIADRLDTLAGGFLAGLEPTGSQDPFGLRRQAHGLLSLCRGAAVNVSLLRALSVAVSAYAKAGLIAEDADPDAAAASAGDFLKVRLQGQLREAGYSADLIEAVLAVAWDVVPDVWERAAAARALRGEPIFDDVYTAFRRAHNLTRGQETGEIDPGLLQTPAEHDLYSAWQQVAAGSETLLAERDYAKFFAAVAPLRVQLDRFLDDVLVMAEDELIRQNRLSLLAAVADLIGKPLDFSRLVV